MGSENKLHVVFGSGALGLGVARILLMEGKRVRIVNRSGKAQIQGNVEIATGDATNAEQTREVCQGAEVVYNCTNAPYTDWPTLFPPIQRGIIAGAAVYTPTLFGSCNFLVNPWQYGKKLLHFSHQNERRSCKGMPTTPLLPLPNGLEITAISVTEHELDVRVTSNRESSLCPLCSTPSSAIHSYYRRKPLELPCAGKAIRLLLSVKKFFCRVATCSRKIFTERLPELIEPSSRLTTRLRTLVQAVCAAFNAQGGARLGEQLGIHLSRMTFLHSLLLLPTPPVGNVKAVGIDDFAWKRGKRYGTVIIDLETHDVLDLLPDREAESVKQWLLAHPEIEIISRDRGGAYADGATQGAPQAQQIADRWHLCKNIGDAVEEYITRKKIQIPPLPPQETVSQEISGTATPVSLPVPMPCQRASQEKRERKQQVVNQARAMYEGGKSIHAIASQLNLARNTVRRYLRLEEPAQPKLRPRKSNLLDPYADYLCERFKTGCSNASQLFGELKEKGYRGGKTMVRNFVARLRKGLPGMARPPKQAKNGELASTLSPRELRWLLSKREEELTSEEKRGLMRLLESSQEVEQVYRLLQSFLHMLRERQPQRLNGWMKEARESGIKELGSFVAGVERDYDAVRAGLTFPWNQGPVEGTVNKIKTHKRLMYGRASFTLLRQKLLHLTSILGGSPKTCMNHCTPLLIMSSAHRQAREAKKEKAVSARASSSRHALGQRSLSGLLTTKQRAIVA